jgi:hypothetical protein
MVSTVGRRQLLAYGQRLCLESSERVVAAIRSSINGEYHALAAVAGRSVCSLATMDPDGFRLLGKRSERTVSSVMWRVFEGNTYIFNDEFTGGEVIVISSQCNGDAMRYEHISENMRCDNYSG